MWIIISRVNLQILGESVISEKNWDPAVIWMEKNPLCFVQLAKWQRQLIPVSINGRVHCPQLLPQMIIHISSTCAAQDTVLPCYPYVSIHAQSQSPLLFSSPFLQISLLTQEAHHPHRAHTYHLGSRGSMTSTHGPDMSQG